MMKNLFILLILMLGGINLINAQDYFCGNDAIFERFNNDPVLLQQYLDNKNPLLYVESEVKRINCTAADVVNIPLAFHFSSDYDCSYSDCILSEIQDAIITLNNNFGNNTGSPNEALCPSAYQDNSGTSVVSTGVCVNFYLAAPPACSDLDPACDAAITIGEFAGGYMSGGSGAGECWDDYLNVFIQAGGNGTLGVSDQIPGYTLAGGPGEGVMVAEGHFGGSVDGSCGTFDDPFAENQPIYPGSILAHEIGHYLACPHIWGDNASCALSGGLDDGFADTPEQGTYFGWGTCATTCEAGGCGVDQQTANFMNYSNCMDLFTEDQAAAMYFNADTMFSDLTIPEVVPTDIFNVCTGNSCCADVDLSILFDGFPGQTTWDITDANGNIVASGGPYPNQTPNSTLNLNPAACLNDGCYTLNFYDSLNNGMCPFQQSIGAVGTFITPGTLITPGTIVGTLGTVVTPGLCGNYSLTDANGASLASGGGRFGAQESNNFCLTNGLSSRLSSKNEHNTRVDILPNPASNFITIRHNMNTDVDIKIIDLSGKTVLAKAMNKIDFSSYQLDVSNLNTGVYMIHLESAEKTVVEKFIKN